MECVMLIALVLQLVVLTGADGRSVELNPASVVSVSAPRPGGEHHASVNCIIRTTDGKFIAVKEECSRVNELLEDSKQQ